MAMQKKFNNPFIFSLRVERETREEILKHTNNMNDFINKAIKNELEKCPAELSLEKCKQCRYFPNGFNCDGCFLNSHFMKLREGLK